MNKEKRTYTKPCILGGEDLKPDQAIAACRIGKGQFYTKFLGYHETWDRSYAGVTNGGGTVFSTIEAAKEDAAKNNHSGAPICGVYGVWHTDGSWVCYYEDLDLDTILDLEGGDNWQNVVSHSEIWSGYYIS